MLELCWGISNYGNRIYTLKYKIKGFVTKYIDKQDIYFNLLNLDQSLGNDTINISSYNGLNINNSKILGFGYKGDVSYEYMVLLVRFEDDYFNTSNISNKSFDSVYEETMKGGWFI